jgi:hypothetical protein
MTSREEQHKPNVRIEVHYEKAAKTYEKAWFYEDGTPYQEFLLEQIRGELALCATDRLVDIGGGTGNFASYMHQQCCLSANVLVVEPSQQLLDQALGRPGVATKLADASSFARNAAAGSFDKALLKEVAHHLHEAPLANSQPGGGTAEARARRQVPLVVFFGDLFTCMVSTAAAPNPRVVIMTRKATADHYPFFRAARDEWCKHQEGPEFYVEAMKRGAEEAFAKIGCLSLSVSIREASYPVRIGKARWFDMIRSRFWSTFSHFSDEEIETGLAQLDGADGLLVKERFLDSVNEPELAFSDKFVFITAEVIKTAENPVDRHSK